eukprot:jgi/Tetstr1/436766/TSEL_025546.t1
MASPASGTSVTLRQANKTTGWAVADMTQPNDHVADTTARRDNAAVTLPAGLKEGPHRRRQDRLGAHVDDALSWRTFCRRRLGKKAGHKNISQREYARFWGFTSDAVYSQQGREL